MVPCRRPLTSHWSNRIVSVWPLSSSTQARSSAVKISCVSQNQPFLNPCWALTRMLFQSRCEEIAWRTKCSTIFPHTDVREIKRLLVGELQSPFLNTGWTSACRQMSGIVSLRRESLKRYAKASASSCTTVPRRWQEMLCGFAALHGFSFFRSFWMPLVVPMMTSPSGYRLSPISSMLARSSALNLKTEQNCSLRMLASAAWSL